MQIHDRERKIYNKYTGHTNYTGQPSTSVLLNSCLEMQCIQTLLYKFVITIIRSLLSVFIDFALLVTVLQLED